MPNQSDATLITAVIGATTAITTGVIAAVTAHRNSKQLAKLQSELARQRDLSLEYMRSYLNLEIEDRNRSLAAYKEIIRLTQLLRELLKRILEYPDAFAPKPTARDLTSRSRAIAECYAENQLLFRDEGDDSDRLIAHALKNESIRAAASAEKYLSQGGQEQRDEALRLLAAITSKQEQLRHRARVCAAAILEDIRLHIDGIVR